jgi:hypothetical protein
MRGTGTQLTGPAASCTSSPVCGLPGIELRVCLLSTPACVPRRHGSVVLPALWAGPGGSPACLLGCCREQARVQALPSLLLHGSQGASGPGLRAGQVQHGVAAPLAAPHRISGPQHLQTHHAHCAIAGDGQQVLFHAIHSVLRGSDARRCAEPAFTPQGDKAGIAAGRSSTVARCWRSLAWWAHLVSCIGGCIHPVSRAACCCIRLEQRLKHTALSIARWVAVWRHRGGSSGQRRRLHLMAGWLVGGDGSEFTGMVCGAQMREHAQRSLATRRGGQPSEQQSRTRSGLYRVCTAVAPARSEARATARGR